MAITDQDALAAALDAARLVDFRKAGATMEIANVLHLHSLTTGLPGVWSPGAPGVNGRATDGTTAADAGTLPCANATLGRRKYLGSLACMASVACKLCLLDLLWVNTGLAVTTTTAQAIVPVAIPARDADGLALGAGVQAGILVTTVTGNVGAITNMTISYTNRQGVAGRTGTIPSTRPGGGFPATCVAGSLIPFDLDAGDDGVRSVQSVTFGTSLVSGAVSLVLFRRLASLPLAANVPGFMGPSDLALPRLFDGVTLHLAQLPSATTATNLDGDAAILEG